MIKRILILILIAIFQIRTLYSEEISLENIIRNFLKESLYIKKNQLELNKIEISKEGNFSDKWEKISFKITPEYSRYYDKDNIPNSIEYSSGLVNYSDEIDNLYLMLYEKRNLTKYPGTIQGKLSYNNTLYMNVVYSNYENFLSKEAYQIGINKSLNDMFYSEQKYKDKGLKIQEKIKKNEIELETINQLKNMVDLYMEINNINDELTVKINSLKLRKEELESLEKKLSYNESVEVDLEYVKIEIKEIENNIEYLSASIKEKEKNLFEKCGLKYKENLIFEPIKDREINEIKVSNLEIETKKNEILMKQEDIKYSKRKYQAGISIDSNYDTKNKILTASLVFSGDIFNYKTDVKIENQNLEKLMLEKKEIEISLMDEKETLKFEYINLKNQAEISKEKFDNMKRRYEISRKIYKEGYMKLLDYLKDEENYDRAAIDYKQVKNKLNAFNYKIEIFEILPEILRN